MIRYNKCCLDMVESKAIKSLFNDHHFFCFTEQLFFIHGVIYDQLIKIDTRRKFRSFSIFAMKFKCMLPRRFYSLV